MMIKTINSPKIFQKITVDVNAVNAHSLSCINQMFIPAAKHSKSLERWNTDPVFQSVWVNRFVSSFVKTGKKRKAELAVHYAFKKVKFVWAAHATYLLTEFIALNRTVIEIKSRRKAKLFLHVPIPVKGHRCFSLSVKRLAKSIIMSTAKTIAERTYQELIDNWIYQRSSFLKSTHDLNKEVKVNRMYLKYRW